MATHYEIIHTDIIDGFTVTLSVAPEDTDPRDHFDDDGETAQAIADGRYDWFMARVDASREGVTLGSDYLGGCCYDTAHAFIRDSGYYNDMVQNAIQYARDTLRALKD
jgi:hypothetical protein